MRPVEIPETETARMNHAADAECQRCGVDAVRAVLVFAAALDENSPRRTVYGFLCTPCLRTEEARRA